MDSTKAGGKGFSPVNSGVPPEFSVRHGASRPTAPNTAGTVAPMSESAYFWRTFNTLRPETGVPQPSLAVPFAAGFSRQLRREELP